jgi:two-component system response regulator ResD
MSAPKARILVIDDDESIRKSISTALKGAEYVVDTAENGKEAIEKSSANFYNLILVDIRLPDMEGTELLTAIKETNPKMIKIVLTGYPSLQNAVEAVNKGADGYKIKPVATEELLKTIKEHLRIQQEERRYSEEKVLQFVKTRVKQLETESEPKPKNTTGNMLKR